MIPKFLFQIWLVEVGIMCGPVIVIFIITIQITSNWPQYNDGLSQTCCFVWSCQMWLPLWCFGKRKKKRFAFEETALAVNWRAGTGGDISLYVCVFVFVFVQEKENKRESEAEGKRICACICVCASNYSAIVHADVCVCLMCVCLFMPVCTDTHMWLCLCSPLSPLGPHSREIQF